MKKTSKVLALVLALVLVFSCVGAEAFAATPGNVKKYNSMVVLGSSIMRGCGLSGYDTISSSAAVQQGLTGSTPSLVAEECLNPGAKRCFATFQGETLASVLCQLGLEDESKDDFLWNPNTNYNWFARNAYPYLKEFCGPNGTFSLKDNLSTAELIVIELGMGDVFYRSKEVSGLAGAFEDGSIADSLPILAKEMAYGCGYVLANYTKLLDFIKTNNPNADVVIVGLYNMFAGLSPIEGLYLPIFDAEAIVSGSINVFLQSVAKKYGYMYADISNVPTPIVEKNLSLTNMGDMNKAVHPTVPSGLEFMARQIINVLPSAEREAPQSKTTIKVDLGFVNDVDYVMVDGLKIKNFSLKNNVLTIPYLLPTAKTVTVGEVDEAGKITVQLYGLNYNLKTGYSAYRLLSNSDVGGTVTSGVKTVTNLLGGLFKK